jgi:cytochrome b involved in lipid metabolism
VTKFIDRHPGGKDVLIMAAGRDITMVFESYHALSDKAHK